MKFSKKLITCILLSTLPLSVWAKTLELHEQPDAKSKVVGSLNTEAGIMPIFTPKNSQWVKVADPHNGNVGWVESKALGNNGFQFKVVTSGDGNHTYQSIQYGNVTPATREQMNKTIQQMEKRYAAIHEDMHRLMHDMFASSFPMMGWKDDVGKEGSKGKK